MRLGNLVLGIWILNLVLRRDFDASLAGFPVF